MLLHRSWWSVLPTTSVYLPAECFSIHFRCAGSVIIMSLVSYAGALPVVARYGSRYALSRGSRLARSALRFGGASVARYAYNNPDKIAGLVGRGLNAAAGRIGRWFRGKRQASINARRGFVTQKGILGRMSFKKGAPLRLKGGNPGLSGLSSLSQRSMRSSSSAGGGQLGGAPGGWRTGKRVGKFDTSVNLKQVLDNMVPIWQYSHEVSGTVETLASHQSFTELHLHTRTHIVERLSKLLSVDINPLSNEALATAQDPLTSGHMNWTTRVKLCGATYKMSLLNECNNHVKVKVLHFVCKKSSQSNLVTAWNHDLEVAETIQNSVAPIGATDPDPTYIGKEPLGGKPIAVSRHWRLIERQSAVMQPGEQHDFNFFIRARDRYMGDWYGDDPQDDGTTDQQKHYIGGVTHAFLIIQYGQLNLRNATSDIAAGPTKTAYKVRIVEKWRACPITKSFQTSDVRQDFGSVADTEWGHFNETTQAEVNYDEDT